MALGDKLSKLRKENNFTQEQIADILGVSRQAVSKWESDTAYPETDKLIQLSNIFSVSIDYLIKDIDKPQTATDGEAEEQSGIDYSSFMRNWCNIDLKNWNSGYDRVILIGQNRQYVFFYQTDRSKALRFGAVRKRHIDTVTQLTFSKRKQNTLPVIPDEPKEVCDPFQYLIGKTCDIQMHSSDLATFILSTDGYQKAVIMSVDSDSVQIQEEGASIILNKRDIVGIVEA